LCIRKERKKGLKLWLQSLILLQIALKWNYTASTRVTLQLQRHQKPS